MIINDLIGGLGNQLFQISAGFAHAKNIKTDYAINYKIGSIFPAEVVPGTPIKQNFNIELEVDDFQTRNVYDYIRTGIHFENIRVILRDQCDTSRQVEYNFEDAHLLSENLSTDNDNNTRVSLRYSTVSRHRPNIIYR